MKSRKFRALIILSFVLVTISSLLVLSACGDNKPYEVVTEGVSVAAGELQFPTGITGPSINGPPRAEPYAKIKNISDKTISVKIQVTSSNGKQYTSTSAVDISPGEEKTVRVLTDVLYIDVESKKVTFSYNYLVSSYD